jgi:carboxyl-terminal processing protease
MTGYFIEAGPIVQVKSRESSPEILRDVDKRVQYDGPLLVMVNNLSASASEILAAALQDYGRAIIVGSTTYGKGTVQRFFNMDNGIPGNPELHPLGEIKVTTQKFYRVNGGSTQLKGVTPDIVLPDEFQLAEVGERQESHPLEWTQIPAVSYDQNVFKIKNLEDLKRRSKARIEKDPVFQKVSQNAKRLKSQRDASVLPLNLEEYRVLEKTREKEAEAFKDFYPKDAIKNVRNLQADLAVPVLDESAKAHNEEFIKSVASDIYIRETIQILHDLIKQ